MMMTITTIKDFEIQIDPVLETVWEKSAGLPEELEIGRAHV